MRLRYVVRARAYERTVTLGPAHRTNARLLVDLTVRAGDRVLDVGVGTGLRLEYGAERASAWVGAETSAAMLARAAHPVATQHLPAASVRWGDAQHLPLGDHGFDTVISSFVLPHLSPEGKRRALAEMYRVLRPGGTLGLFLARGEVSPLFSTRETLEALLREAGFVRVAVQVAVQDRDDVYRVVTARAPRRHCPPRTPRRPSGRRDRGPGDRGRYTPGQPHSGTQCPPQARSLHPTGRPHRLGSLARILRGPRPMRSHPPAARAPVAPVGLSPVSAETGDLTAFSYSRRKMTKPTHETVRAAVTRSGDRQLDALIQGPGSYVLRAETAPDVEHHQVFRVLLTETDHPMSFWIATDPDATTASVLSGQLDAVSGFLASEPRVVGAADLVARFHDLFRPQGVHSKVLDDPAPRVSRDSTGVALRYAVLIDGEREEWSVRLPANGRPTILTQPLPVRRQEELG